MSRRSQKPRPPYRSHLEVRVADLLTSSGVRYSYEEWSYEYDYPIPRGVCDSCGGQDIYTERTYTPDFFLPNGIVVEAKGKMTAPVRKKMLAVKASWPDLDLRLLFMRDNKIHKNSTTRYTEWATKHGFPNSVEPIPQEWVDEAKAKQ